MSTDDRFAHDLRTSDHGDTYRCEHCGMADDDNTVSECPVLLRSEVARLTAERDRLAKVAAPLVRWAIVRAKLADSDGWHLSACESPHRLYETRAEAERAIERHRLNEHVVVPVYPDPRSAWLDRAVVTRG